MPVRNIGGGGMNSNKNVILHDAIDRVVYEDLLGQAQGLYSVVEAGQKIVKTFAPLSADVFFSLYKPSPEFSADVASEYQLNKDEISKLIESPSYKELREYTVLDELSAGMGSKALLEGLVKQLQEDETLRDAVDKVNKAAAAREAATQFNELSQEFAEKMKEAKALSDEVKSLLATQQSNLRRAMSAAAGSALQEVEAVDELVISWGLDKGSFQRLPVDKKLAILSVLKEQKKFKDMGKLVGRMRNIATASRKARLESEKVELHSVTVGNDISRLLPQELVALRKPALKRDFYRKLAEKQLMQYDLTHKSKAGRGPIVCLIDTSGSMRKENREEWSKAVALGLAEIAAREKRAFAYALFGSSCDELITGEFISGRPTPEQLLALAQGFIGGGTDFEKPLKFAVEKLSESKFKKADIVLITDGECAVSEEFLTSLVQTKQHKEFRIYSVLIGGSPRELNRWSDEVWSVQDLFDDRVAKELFSII